MVLPIADLSHLAVWPLPVALCISTVSEKDARTSVVETMLEKLVGADEAGGHTKCAALSDHLWELL